MAFTSAGDANLDGVVNDDDVTIVGATYAPGVSQPHWALGDFDYNGFVDDDDVTLLGVFYDPSATPFGMIVPAVTQPTTSVPEPAGVALVATVCTMMLFLAHRRVTARRRRRRVPALTDGSSLPAGREPRACPTPRFGSYCQSCPRPAACHWG
jgi:hypothetical protein